MASLAVLPDLAREPGIAPLVCLLAVIFSGWYGGFGPGISATVTVVVLSLNADYPGSRQVGYVLFIAEGTLISALMGNRGAAQRKARVGEERLQSVLDNIVDAIITIDEAGVMQTANTATERFFGYTANELVGRNVSMLMAEPDRSAHDAYVANYLRTGEAKIIGIGRDVRGLRRDGSVFEMDLHVGEFHSAGQRYFTGVVRDISERKRSEERLSESEAKFRQIAENLGEVVWMGDPTIKTIFYVNPAYERVWGRTCESLYDRPLSFVEGVHPDDRPRLEAALAAQQRLPSDSVVEYRVVRPDGSVRWIEDRASQIRDAEGRVSRLVGVAWDITERKATEWALRTSEERLALATESAGLGTWDSDLTPGNITFSPRLEELFGFAPGEFDGTSKSLLDRVHPEDRDGFVRAITGARDSRGLYNHEYRVVLPGGSVRWIASLGRYSYNESGTAVRVAGVAKDVTEQKQAEQALAESERRFRDIYETAPVSICLEDWTGVIEALEELRNQGVTDFPSYFRDHPEFIARMLRAVEILDVNPWTLALYEAADRSEFLGSLETVFATPDTLPGFVEELTALTQGRASLQTEMAVNTVKGATIRIALGMAFPRPGSESGRVFVSVVDITQRWRAECRLATQAAVSRVLAEAASLEEATSDIIRVLCETEGWDFGAIWEVDKGTGTLRSTDTWHRPGLAAADLAARTRALTLAPGVGLPGRVWSAAQPLFIPDLARDDHYVHAACIIELGLRSAMAFPILKDGEVSGIIHLLGSETHEPDESLIEMFGAIGRQIGQFLERKRAEEALRSYAARLENLRGIDEAILMAREPQALAEVALRQLERLVPSWMGSVVVVDYPRNELNLVACSGHIAEFFPPGTRFTFDLKGHPDMEALREGRAASRDDLQGVDLRSRPEMERLRANGLRSYVLVPMMDRGELVGALCLGSDRPGAYTPEHIEVSREVADHLAIAIRQALLFEENRSAKDRLESLSRRLIHAEEEERRRISRELHDEIGQGLTALKINLQKAIGGMGDAAQRLGESIEIVDRTLQQVRGMALDLRPSLLDDLGLFAALEWYVRRHTERTGMEGRFVADPVEVRADAEVETACFRVVQEALTNVVRHARATRFSVELLQHSEGLHLVVRDNGMGFDPPVAIEAARHGISLGLCTMRERVELIGGRISFVSEPGKGTEIQVDFPNVPAHGPVTEEGRA